MAANKKYDISVVTGSYVDRNGNPKKQYKTVGAVFETERGLFATLDRSFNPAGIPTDRDSIMLSFFEPKPRQASGGASSSDVEESDVPF